MALRLPLSSLTNETINGFELQLNVCDDQVYGCRANRVAEARA